MTSVTVIDDEKTFPFPEDWDAYYCRTLQQGDLRLRFLMDRQMPFDQLWLDHDLGGDDTIRPLVRWLEEEAHYGHKLQCQQVVVCSLNAPGADWMVDTLAKDYLTTRCTDPTENAQLSDKCGEGKSYCRHGVG